MHADVVRGLLTLQAKVIAGSQYKASARAELLERFAPALVGHHSVNFNAVSTNICQGMLSVVMTMRICFVVKLLCG